jgi:uncharacterized delta-60 repeat protein
VGLLAVVLTLSLMVPGQVVAQEVDSPVPDDAVVAAAVPATPGDLDTTFSGDGKVTTDFGGFSDTAHALAIQPDGKLVVAGIAGASSFDFALARYLPNGSLDPTFSGDGKVTTVFSGGFDAAQALAIQPNNGRLVVAGFADGFGNGAFALARYHAFQCVGFAATRVGTASKDTLNGTAGSDVIIGLGGDDMISGLGGNDVLCGVNGNDTVHGGGGNDTVRGGNGDDALFGEAGTDSCDGGPHVHGDTASSCESVINVP